LKIAKTLPNESPTVIKAEYARYKQNKQENNYICNIEISPLFRMALYLVFLSLVNSFDFRFFPACPPLRLVFEFDYETHDVSECGQPDLQES